MSIVKGGEVEKRRERRGVRSMIDREFWSVGRVSGAGDMGHRARANSALRVELLQDLRSDQKVVKRAFLEYCL